LAEACSQWYYINNGVAKINVSFAPCGDCEGSKEIDINAGEVGYIDACINTTPTVMSGSSDGLVLVKYCGACELPIGEYPYCVTWEVYDITATTSVSYEICGGGTYILDINAESPPEPFCVQYPYIPVLEDPTKAKLRIKENECNCAPPPP
jgi:hypothetical protein